VALRLFTGEPQRAGRTCWLTDRPAADLCRLRVPLREALRALSGELVRAAYMAGRRIAPV
jgi:hypothetical protein